MINSEIYYKVPIPNPPFFGRKVIKDIFIDDTISYLNKKLLFKSKWKFQNNEISEADRKFKKIVYKAKKEHLLELNAVYGYFQCYSNKNKLFILNPDNKKEMEFIFPQQNYPHYLCLSRYFRPFDKENYDVVSLYIVTIGHQASEESKKYSNENKYYDYLIWYNFCAAITEALAQYIHRHIRIELGIEKSQTPEEILKGKFQGKRYSFGYPVCPSLEDQKKLFKLLKPEEINVSLTETYQLVPEMSTSGIIVYNPDAVYFSLKKEKS